MDSYPAICAQRWTGQPPRLKNPAAGILVYREQGSKLNGIIYYTLSLKIKNIFINFYEFFYLMRIASKIGFNSKPQKSTLYCQTTKHYDTFINIMRRSNR